MMRVFHSLRELNFSKLMEVYTEGNLQNAEERWPDESLERGLQLAEEDFRDYLQNVFFCEKGACYIVWTEAESYVSALRLEPYRDGWLLEALETAPKYRRKGYAETLVRSVQDLGAFERIYSHVHKKNLPSRKLHEKCGFRQISQQAAYVDGSVNSHACTMLYER